MTRYRVHTIIRRAVAALSVLSMTLLPIAATAQPSPGSASWQGAWSGANLDFSTATSADTTTPNPNNPVVTPPPVASNSTVPAPNTIYVALGDSVAAGLGLAPLASPTGTDTQCGRSKDAYASQVAVNLGLQLTNIACSGAKAGDLFTRQGVSGPNISPQLNTAFANGTPQLITITAGANDAHWVEFLKACYAWNCGNKTDTAIADGYLSFLRLKLYYLFADIEARSSSTPPKVIITGYYNPLSSQCLTTQTKITAPELQWINNELSKLNATIQSVASQYSSFVTYTPVNFTGHDICSNQPWVQGPTDKAPFHPNAAGQQAIANTIIAAYKQ